MRDRRDIIVLTLLLASFAVIALLGRPQASARAADDPRASTFRSSQHGTRALYLVLDELGIEAAQLLRPWTHEDLRGVVVVLAPLAQVTPREVESLVAWVRDGGSLIIAGTRPAPLAVALRLHAMQLGSDSVTAFPGTQRSGSTALVAAHAWTHGIDSVPGFGRAFHPRSLPGGTEVLLTDRHEAPLVVVFPFGAGRVMAWSDAAPLTNRLLRDGGAALLFARAAAAWGDDATILFDEYHHGYREGGPVHALSRFVRDTGAGRALLQAAVAALLVLVLHAHRFGEPVPDRPAVRRSPLEHVEAVAGAYRGADARGTARRLLLAGAERRLGRRLLHGDALRVLDSTPAGRRLREEWTRGERGALPDLAAAIDDYLVEVRRWR